MKTEITYNLHQKFVDLKLPKSFAVVLIKNIDDFDTFLANYYKSNRYIIDDLLDYREDKIKNSSITINEFLDQCFYGNIEQAFESTFLQEFSLEDFQLIRESIQKGKLDLEELFNNFKKNPNKNILKYVL